MYHDYEGLDLRLFLSIADQLSLTKAAASSHLSLAAVSNRIKRLEETTKCKLLERHPRGVSLTPAGDAFAKNARLVLRQFESLNLQLADFAAGVQGHVNVFASITGCTEIMPTVLARWLPLNPHVSVSLKEVDSSEVARALREGRADIGVISGSFDLAGLEVLHFATDRVALILPSSHPLSSREATSFAETMGMPSVSLHGSLERFLADRVSDMGMPPRRHRAEVNSYEALCLLVEADVGVAFAGESAITRHQKTMDITCVPLSDPWALRNRYVVSRVLASAPKYVADLVCEIAAHGRE